MKKSIIILIILFAHLNVFSQEYVWTVYNIKVDRVNAGQVVTAMDKYLSKPGNLVEGVKPGDIIYYDRHAGHNIEFKEKLHHVIKIQDVVIVE